MRWFFMSGWGRLLIIAWGLWTLVAINDVDQEAHYSWTTEMWIKLGFRAVLLPGIVALLVWWVVRGFRNQKQKPPTG